MVKDNINSLIMSAMKAGEKTRLEALRAVKNAFMVWESAKENVGKSIDETTEIAIMKKLVAQYKDTAAQCNDGQHDDIVKESLAYVAVIEEFLPAPVTEDDIIKAFDTIASNLGLDLIKRNMGTFVKEIKAALSGADGKMVASIVGARLS